MENLKNKRVLVTGGAGFIGSHLSERLASEGCILHIVTGPVEGLENLKSVRAVANLHKADIRDREKISEIVSSINPHYVFHLAASLKRGREPEIIDEIMSINFQGTLNMLEACKNLGVEKFVFISTSDVYGSNKSPFKEDQPIDPISPYSLSKAAAELVCKMYFKTFGLPVTVIRSFLTYGPRQKPELLIPEVIVAGIKKTEFKMTKGEQERDINYVDDVVEALLKACTAKEAVGETINIGTGKKYKIVDIVKKILDLMGNPINPQIGALPYRANEVWEMYCDNSKAKRLLGWEPKTSLEEGLKKTVRWYMENYR